MAVALRHAREQAPAPGAVLPAITPAVDHVVTTATARDPDDRFPSLDALLTELRAAVGSTGTSDDAWPPRVRTAALRTPHTATGRRSDGPGSQPAPQRWGEAGGARQPVPQPDQHEPRAQPVAAHARSRARRRGAPAADDRRNPAGAAPAPAPRQRPIYVRARMSALALMALAFTLFEAGMIGAPLLGVLALRRIDRSHGALRGEAVAALAIVAIGTINYLGVRRAAAVMSLATAAKYAALLGLGLLAFTVVRGAHSSPPSLLPGHGVSVSLLATALIPVMWTYDGWADLSFMGGEVARPQRTLPLALTLGAVSVMLVYLLVNTFLVIVWAATSGPDGFFWPVFPIAGWGIGVVANWYDAYRGGDFTEESIEREMERMARRH